MKTIIGMAGSDYEISSFSAVIPSREDEVPIAPSAGSKDAAAATEDQPLTRSIVLLTFFSALGGFLFGYDTGVVSGAMLLIRKDFELSTLWQELIISITIVAAWLSSLVGGPSADYFGRKKVIIFSSIVFVCGSVVLGLSNSEESLLVGRTIVGIGIGLTSMVVPVFISEVAPLSFRGRLTVTNTLFVTGGQFCAGVICGLFSGVDEGWRWMLGLGAVPAFIQLVAFFFSPESPRWLSMRGRLEECREVLRKYRPVNADIDEEVKSFEQKSVTESSLKAVLRSDPVRRALVLGCLLQFYQQFAGINTVMYYSASIIAMAGVSDESTAIWLAAATSFFNFSFTFVGLYLVERVGRRPLTLWSLLGVTGALLVLGLSFHLASLNSPSIDPSGEAGNCTGYRSCFGCTEDPECGFCFYGSVNDVRNASCLPANHSQYNEVSTFGDCAISSDGSEAVFAYDWCPSKLAWVSVFGLCLYLCFFAPGMGPMPWTINSEIYPNWARARCTSLATSVNWASNLVVSLTFLSLTEALTNYGAFYLYMCFAFSGFVVFCFILPETKGVQLEQVESIFSGPLCSSRPWKKQKKEHFIQNVKVYGTM